jgi:hypothetical protein
MRQQQQQQQIVVVFREFRISSKSLSCGALPVECKFPIAPIKTSDAGARQKIHFPGNQFSAESAGGRELLTTYTVPSAGIEEYGISTMYNERFYHVENSVTAFRPGEVST